MPAIKAGIFVFFKKIMYYNSSWKSCMKLKYLVLAFCLVIIGFDAFLMLKYMCPVSKSTRPDITTNQEPYQHIYAHPKKHIIVKDIYKRPYALEPVAAYSISGMLVAKNYNFGSKLLTKKGFNSIALMDIGLVWGRMADEKLLKKYFKIRSHDVGVGGRRLSWRYSREVTNFMSTDYVNSHISHTHIIPKNDNVMAALMKMKKYDKVKLNGYLVDIYDDKARRFVMTSIARDDMDTTSRGWGQGGGGCEVMYVINVQLGNRFYD